MVSSSSSHLLRVVTTAVSRVSNPGDPRTNKIYTEIVDRLAARVPEKAREDGFVYENNLQRAATDEELSVLILGPDGRQVPVHSAEYLEKMRENSRKATEKYDAWQQATKEHEEEAKKTSSADDGGGWGMCLAPPPSKIPPLLRAGNSAACDRNKTEDAARKAVAALIDLAKDVWNNGRRDASKPSHAFSLTKPPSHHTVGNSELARYPEELRAGEEEANTPLGFCHLNAIAAACGQLLSIEGKDGIAPERIAILDFDVHHGNGNEDTFYHDPRVLTISLHEEGIWPGDDNGRPEYTGDEKQAPGSNLNVRLPTGSGDTAYCRAMEESVFKKLEDFQPALIFVAAGFDAMLGDGYANQKLTAEWYAWCLQELRKRFDGDRTNGGHGKPHVPLILNLEGGYRPSNVENAVVRCLDALLPSPKFTFELESVDECEDRERLESGTTMKKERDDLREALLLGRSEGVPVTETEVDEAVATLRQQRSERRRVRAIPV